MISPTVFLSMDQNDVEIDDSRPDRTNVPGEPLRWSLLSASREFGLYRTTLQKRLIESDVQSGADGLYSTPDILKALDGDLDAEKLRKVREEADRVALQNAASRRESLPAKEVSQVLSKVMLAIRTEILVNNDLTADAKDSLLLHLKELCTQV